MNKLPELRGPVETSSENATSQNGRQLFVIGYRCGRLANRLVLFANFIALAEEYGSRVINFTFHSYAHLFETTSRDVYCQYPVPRRRSWMDVTPGIAPAIRTTRILYRAARAASVLNDRFGLFGSQALTLHESGPGDITDLETPELQPQLRNRRLIFVYGWNFRAPGLVQKHATKIRAYFRPTEHNRLASERTVESLRQQADIIIGVHIRHGDYAHWKRGHYFFPVSQYAIWMRQIAAQFQNKKVAFVVCSDEHRDEHEFPGLKVGINSASPVQDLYALSECDYILGPLSTFSQWASFYGNKPLFQISGADDSMDLCKFKVSDLKEMPPRSAPSCNDATCRPPSN